MSLHAARASRIRLVLTDCDGVLTDGGVYYGDGGELFKRFDVRDGMGVERLRAKGIDTAIVTRETSESVRRRSEKLRLNHTFLGIRDKRERLPALLLACGVEWDQVACIGDDVNDLDSLIAIGAHGLTGAPADAMPEVREAVHHVCARPGGHGAFRDFAEWILALRTCAVDRTAGGGKG